jgi:hypothetical protein
MAKIKNFWFAIIEGKMGSDNHKVVNVTYDTYEGAFKLMQSYEKDYPEKRFNLFQGKVV